MSGYPDFSVLAPKRLQDCLASPPGAFSAYQEVWDQILCCLCFSMFYPEDLEPVSDNPKQHWDVCKGCAYIDSQSGGEY